MHTFRQAERTRDRQDLARDVCPFWVKNEKSALVVGRFRFRPSRLGHFQNRLYWRALRGVSLLGTPTREARIVVKKRKKTMNFEIFRKILLKSPKICYFSPKFSRIFAGIAQNVRNFDGLDVANFKNPEFFQKIPKFCRNILQKLSR